MTGYTTNRTSTRPSRAFYVDTVTPGVLVAAAPRSATETDRFHLSVPFSVGRGSENTLSIRDDKVSKRHFEITHAHGGYWIKDLGSTNGTFVNGERVDNRAPLPTGAVIRAGRAVLVFHEDAGPMLAPPCAERYGFAGRFHASPLIERLREAAGSRRHVLLVGATGTGKELAAGALKDIVFDGDASQVFLRRNCGQFVNSDEAKSTLFGVDKGVFPTVTERNGLIADAAGGVLYLDEIHRLPDDVKGALLRVVEYGTYSRAGETIERKANVRFILATNAPDALPSDLTPRLRVETIPPLSERIADIPSIFDAVLISAIADQNLNANDVLPLIRADHYESMCLDGFEAENVRGLRDIADRIATRITSDNEANEAIVAVFSDRYGNGRVARRLRGDNGSESGHYEPNKLQIIQVFHECKGNLSKTERVLRSRGVACNRKWLGIYLRKWGALK